MDLGILTEACITRPEICGAAGGPLGFWIRRIYWNTQREVISSHAETGTYFQITLDGIRLR